MVGSVLALFLLVFLLIQVPAIQNFLKNQAVAYLEKKLGTRVAVDRLSIAFPKKIVLEGIYLEDQRKDTLLAGERVAVDIELLKLLQSSVVVKNLELEGIRANIYRTGADTTFNYQYIVDAFASPSQTKTDTTGSMRFEVDRLALRRIVASYVDDQAGMNLYTSLGKLDVQMREFNPDRLRFGVPQIGLENTRVVIRQYKPLIEAPKSMMAHEIESSEPIAMVLKLGTIDLKQIDFDYENTVQDVSAKLTLGAFGTEVDSLDLGKLYIDLDRFNLSNTQGVVRFGPTPPAQLVAEETGETIQATVNNPWRLLIDQLALTNVNVKFDNDGERRQPVGMDYAHLDVQNLLLDGDNMVFTPARFEGSVDRMELNEQNSRFRLRNLRTDFVYNDSGINLNNLYVETDKTLLRDRIVVGWPSLDALAKDPGVMLIQGNLRNSKLSAQDLITFAPLLKDVPPFQKAPNAIYTINELNVVGRLRNLRFNALDIAGLQDTRVRLTGTVRGSPDPVNTVYDVKIAQLRATSQDFNTFLPPNTLPDNIQIPERLTMTGTFTGKVIDFRSNFNLTTNRGTARGTLAMRNYGEGGYRIDAVTNGLDLGFITKQPQTIGKVSARVVANGAGFDPKTAAATYNAQVYSAYFNGYNYRDVAVSGTLKSGIATVNGVSKDPNLGTDFALTIDLNTKTPAIAGKINLSSIDLQALRFSPTPFRVNGNIVADISSLDPDNPIGTVTVRNASFDVNGQKFTTDSIDVYALRSADSGYMVRVNSDALNALMYGNFALTQIGPSVMELVNRYYQLPGFKPTQTRPQDFVLTAVARPSSPLLLGFVPELKGSEPINIYTAFNSVNTLLDARVQSPRLYYAQNRIDTLSFTATTADPALLAYNLKTNGVHAPSMHIYQTALQGGVANNTVDFRLNNKDIADVPRYALSGTVQPTPQDGFRLALAQDTVLLNYASWMVPDSNYLEYSDAGIVANQFAFIRNNESFGLYSTAPDPKAPIELRFRNFEIATLTNFAGQDSLQLAGQINGYASVENPLGTIPAFSSDLRVQNLVYNRDTIGTIVVQADNATEDAITANVALSGYGNDMRLNGVYYLAGQKVDMNLNIGNLNLQKLPALSVGQIEEAGGGLKGNIDVLGTLDDPDVNGNLHFDSAFFTPTMLGARLYVPSDNIFITPQGVRFNRFTLLDSAGKQAIVNGDILTSDFKKYRFDLQVTAEDFLIANAQRKAGSEQMFYGRLNISTDTRITGTLTAPNVDGTVDVNKGTDFKILMPSSNPEVDAGVGVVKFVDQDNPTHSQLVNQEFDTLKARTEMAGVRADLNVRTDSAAQFTVVIDERNGDALSVRGTSNLSLGLDRSGQFSMTGNYLLQNGSYLMTLNFLKRQFFIRPGSTITWTGEPTTATVDVTATYTATTASIDLVADQLAGSSQTELTRYRQQLPFEVQLRMRGELLKPVISFDIVLPDRLSSQWDVVKSRLEQLRTNESELNKQVFALLLLNRFVSESPLKDFGDEGSVADRYIRQSASRLLTDQINRLASSLISFVDVNIGVNSSEDYTTGSYAQRTDLSVGLSKRLLNDRLRVNVGSNFMLEGPQQYNQSASQIAGDLSVEYLLTKDGRYQLRTYRRNQYTDIVLGQVIETGAGVGVNVNYDRFREIFQSAEKARTLRLQKRQKARNADPQP